MTHKKDVLKLANKVSSICDTTYRSGLESIDQTLQDLSNIKKSLEKKPEEPKAIKLAQAIEWFVTNIDWFNGWLSDNLVEVGGAVSRLREDLDKI